MLRRHERLTFAGSLHFITTVTERRGNWFVREEDCRAILELFEHCRAKHGLHCLGYVLMPDHLHAVLFQSTEGPIVSRMMAEFKSESSLNCRPRAYPEAHLWRRRYDDVPLPGTKAVWRRIHYAHGNPLKRGLAERIEDYPWSSARDFLGISEGIVRVSIELLPVELS